MCAMSAKQRRDHTLQSIAQNCCNDERNIIEMKLKRISRLNTESKYLISFICWIFFHSTLFSQTGSISNISVSQRTDGSGKVDIDFTLNGTVSVYYVAVEASFNGGNTFMPIPAGFLSGDTGPISPGAGKHIIWNGLQSFPNTYSVQSKVKLTPTTTPPSGVPCPGTPTVVYGGQTYNTVQIGTQCWLKENLNIGTMINGSSNQTNNGIIEKYCYNNLESNCNIYGGLYQWNEMMQYVTTPGLKGICPSGWHLPTDGEWTTLTNYASGENIAGGKLKSVRTVPDPHPRWDSPNTGAIDDYEFSIFPSGNLKALDDFFFNQGRYAFIWTSTEYNYAYAWHRVFIYNSNAIQRTYYSVYHDSKKTNGFSIRCLMDN